jgi:hypothetical protein
MDGRSENNKFKDFYKSKPDSTYETWLQDPCFSERELAGQLGFGDKVIIGTFKDCLAEYDQRIPKLSKVAQEKYPSVLIKSFEYCVNEQIEKKSTYTLPLTLLDDLVSSPHFKLKDMTCGEDKQDVLHTMVKQAKPESKHYHVYRHAVEALLEAKDISRVINITDEKVNRPASYAVINQDFETLKCLINKGATHNCTYDECLEISETCSKENLLLVLRSELSFMYNNKPAHGKIAQEFILKAADQGDANLLLGLQEIGFNIDDVLKKYDGIENIKKRKIVQENLKTIYHKPEDDLWLSKEILSKEKKEFSEFLKLHDSIHFETKDPTHQKKYSACLLNTAKSGISDEKYSIHLDALFESPYFTPDQQIKLLVDTAMTITDSKAENLSLNRLLASQALCIYDMELEAILYNGETLFYSIVEQCKERNNFAPLTQLLENQTIKKLINIPSTKNTLPATLALNDKNSLEFLVTHGAKHSCGYYELKKLHKKLTPAHFNLILTSLKDINSRNPDTNLTLPEYTIFGDGYGLFAELYNHGAKIDNSLALCGLQGIKYLQKQKKNKEINDIPLVQELKRFEKQTTLLSIHFADVLINILTVPIKTYRERALQAMVQIFPDFKERLFAFITSLSRESRAYLFTQSFVENSPLYIIWHTPRIKGGTPPTIERGRLQKVYDANQALINVTQNTEEVVLEEIRHYPERFKKYTLLPPSDEKMLPSTPTKYERDKLLPVELAILNKDIPVACSLLDHKEIKETLDSTYLLALAGKERIQQFMKKSLKKCEAVLLNNALQVSLKEIDNNFIKLYQDIIAEKISPDMVREIVINFPEFPEKMLAYLKSQGPEKECEILKYALTRNNPLSFTLSGNSENGSRLKAYTRMQALEHAFEKEKERDQKKYSTSHSFVKDDPAKQRLHDIFTKRLADYIADLNKKDPVEHPRLFNKIKICEMCLNITETGKIPEDIQNLLRQDKYILPIFTLLEETYESTQIFTKGSLLSFFDNQLATALNELLVYEHKKITTPPPLTTFNTSSLPASAPISFVAPMSISYVEKKPSAPYEPLYETPPSIISHNNIPIDSHEELPLYSAQQLLTSTPMSFLETATTNESTTTRPPSTTVNTNSSSTLANNRHTLFPPEQKVEKSSPGNLKKEAPTLRKTRVAVPI